MAHEHRSATKTVQKLVPKRPCCRKPMSALLLRNRTYFMQAPTKNMYTFSARAIAAGATQTILLPSLFCEIPLLAVGLLQPLLLKKTRMQLWPWCMRITWCKMQREFEQKLKVCVNLAAEQGTFNIIEVKAKHPNVNLGYVKTGTKLEDRDDVEIYAFEAFKENRITKQQNGFCSFLQLPMEHRLLCGVSSILEAFCPALTSNSCPIDGHSKWWLHSRALSFM